MNVLVRRLRWILIAIFMSLPVIAAAQTGHWESGRYGNLFGSRDYQTWIPAGYTGTEDLPLLLVLHGCDGDGSQIAGMTRFNEIADVEQFIVVYPSQSVLANLLKCWNWSSVLSQSRNIGEPSILAGIVAKAKADYSIDASRVYVTGFSAGGAMTSIMLACYSDVFAAGAVHSGGMYKAAISFVGGVFRLSSGSVFSPDARGKDAWQCSGSPSPRQVPVLVFHGSADSLVNPVNGEQTVQQFLQTNDFGDDGLDNDSVGNAVTSTSTAQVPGGRSYTVNTYAYGGTELVQHYVVDGLDHAWSGGDATYGADPAGPDASLIMWVFFKDKHR